MTRCYICDRPAAKSTTDVPLCLRCIIERADNLLEQVPPSPPEKFRRELDGEWLEVVRSTGEVARIPLGGSKLVKAKGPTEFIVVENEWEWDNSPVFIAGTGICCADLGEQFRVRLHTYWDREKVKPYPIKVFGA